MAAIRMAPDNQRGETNLNDVIYPGAVLRPRRRLRHRAGGSASRAYQVAARRRRRVRRATVVLAVVAAATAVLLMRSAVGGGRVRPGRLEAVAVVAAVAAGSVVLLRFPGYGGRDVERWARGAEGEMATEEALRALRSRRWAVWHDLAVPGSRANIDHLVAGRTGVWVVDTKTTRAAVSCTWRTVRFGDRRLDTRSTRWEAEVVADVLGADPAAARLRRRTVRPIVAVHGSGLSPGGGRAGRVPVVAVADLVARIERGRRRIPRRRMAAVVAALEAQFGPAGAPDGPAPRRQRVAPEGRVPRSGGAPGGLHV